jgi:hypothetical protein
MKNFTRYVKILSVFLLALLTGVGLQGQSTVNYTFATTTMGSLTDMSSGTTQIVGGSSDQGVSAATNIGFTFTFMGTQYTQFSASANGLIRLGSTAIGTTTYAIGAASQALISPLAGDLETSSTGKVHFKTTGTAPNRVLVVEFLNMGLDYTGTYTGADGTYQALLYETTGKIEFVYGSMYRNSSAVNGASFNTGISSNSTANAITSVNTTANTVSTSATVTTNTYAVSTNIADLNSSANGSRRTYTFTPPMPSAAPTALNFTGVSASATTLNWTDGVSNELAYVVYRSTDNVTFTYAGQTAANAVTYAATGLTSATTYYWQVYAITEGGVSSALVGTQATSATQTYYWQPTTGTTNNWSTASNWNTAANGSGTQRTTPDATDILIFNNGGNSTAVTSAAVTQTIAQIIVSGNTTMEQERI